MSTPEQFLEHAERLVDERQRQWLQPLGPVRAMLHRLLFETSRCCVRLAFRFRVEGQQWLPAERPVIVAPNHESSMDGPLLAAAMPYAFARHTSAAVRQGRVFGRRLVEQLHRICQTVPVNRNLTALAAGAAVLRRKHNLVWFPEGTRTRNGGLQEFKFGIGALAYHFQVPIVPVGIVGAFEALPPGARWPRWFAPIVVRFGEPLLPQQFDEQLDKSEAYRQIVDALRERVEQLSAHGRQPLSSDRMPAKQTVAEIAPR